MTQQIVEKTETPAPAKKKSDQNEKLSQANGKKSTMPTPVADEWSGLHPTQKDMGLIQLTLDKGVKTTVVGTFTDWTLRSKTRATWSTSFSTTTTGG